MNEGRRKKNIQVDKCEQEFQLNVPYWRHSHKIAMWYESLSPSQNNWNLCTLRIISSLVLLNLTHHTINLEISEIISMFYIENILIWEKFGYVIWFPIYFQIEIVYAPVWCKSLAMKLIFGNDSSLTVREKDGIFALYWHSTSIYSQLFNDYFNLE